MHISLLFLIFGLRQEWELGLTLDHYSCAVRVKRRDKRSEREKGCMKWMYRRRTDKITLFLLQKLRNWIAYAA